MLGLLILKLFPGMKITLQKFVLQLNHIKRQSRKLSAALLYSVNGNIAVSPRGKVENLEI